MNPSMKAHMTAKTWILHRYKQRAKCSSSHTHKQVCFTYSQKFVLGFEAFHNLEARTSIFVLNTIQKVCKKLYVCTILLSWKMPLLWRIFAAHTLSILFSMKSSKTWIAPIFIPLYFISVSSCDDGLIRTSKQETGTLLKRLTALLKQILKIHYSFERKN